MGPITLFDKSFLQSLSLDESVWFDHFFLANVCPFFYVETLADLEKSVREGRTPEQEVGIIASKFAEMHGSPNAYHLDLCAGNLLGHTIPMTGQIPMTGGHVAKTPGKTGVAFKLSPEAEAFSRWQKHEFLKIERKFAKVWRESVSTLDLDKVSEGFQILGVNGKSCKSLQEVKTLAQRVVSSRDSPSERMKLALLFLNIPQSLRPRILDRWKTVEYPPLVEFAPFAAYVLTVEIFLQVALDAGLISKERRSNRVDIAYLFYLPFCMMFVSSDRLHRRCAPLFLRKDQQFVWGQDLKAGLASLNEYYSELPDNIREKGIMSFASHPPKEGDFLVARIWDRHFPDWRMIKEKSPPNDSTNGSKLMREFNKTIDSPPLSEEEADLDPRDLDALFVERRIRKTKGSWYQIPKDLELPDDE